MTEYFLLMSAFLCEKYDLNANKSCQISYKVYFKDRIVFKKNYDVIMNQHLYVRL